MNEFKWLNEGQTYGLDYLLGSEESDKKEQPLVMRPFSWQNDEQQLGDLRSPEAPIKNRAAL